MSTTTIAPGLRGRARQEGEHTEMDTEIIPQVRGAKRCLQCTDEYDLFKTCGEQRLLRPALVAKITRSMKRLGFVATTPIVVNEQMEIIDGQHRFQAAKNLGIPFYFLVDDRLKVGDVREMAKAAAAWSFDDYVTSHVRQGNADYIRLRDLKELSGLGWSAFMHGAFADYRGREEDIALGRFNLSERKEAEIIDFLAKFDIFKPIYKYWMHRGFVVACAIIFSHANYDHEQMKARLEYQSTRLVRCANAEDYVKLLESIYNYKSHAHKIVDFSKSARSTK